MTSQYNATYIRTHDIDWFCQVGDATIHCASNGGSLPLKVNNRLNNQAIQKAVVEKPPIFDPKNDIELNLKYILARLGENVQQESFEAYIKTFVDMATKGFVSMDRELGRDSYIWIARPKTIATVEIENLPLYQGTHCGQFVNLHERIIIADLDKE